MGEQGKPLGFIIRLLAIATPAIVAIDMIVVVSEVNIITEINDAL
jgi:hypothetical protein